MRSLTSTLEAEQQDTSVAAIYRFVIDGDTFSHASTNRIIEIDHTEKQFTQEARILIDNSDGGITKDYKGLEGVLSYGATGSSGDEYSACAPLTVFFQQNHSSQGVLTVEFLTIGLADLIAEDRASEQFTMEASDTRTVKTLITAVIQATLPSFTHTVAYTATFDSEDSLVDSYKPANGYSFSLNTTRLQVIQNLLDFTRIVMRVEADGAFHFFVPTTEGPDWLASTAYSLQDYVRDPTSPANNFAFRCTTAGTTGASEPAWPTVAGNTVTDGSVVWTAVDFDEEYRVNVSGQHELLEKVSRFGLALPNRIEVTSHPDSDDAFSGTAEDTDSSDITNMEKRHHIYATLSSDAEAADMAFAILEGNKLNNQRGAALVPMNVAQETSDWIKLTDSRDAGNVRLGNIATIQRIVGHGKYQMQFSFGGIKDVGAPFAGLFFSSELTQELIGSTQIDPTGDSLADLAEQFNAIINDSDSRMTRLLLALGQDIGRLFDNDVVFRDTINQIIAAQVGSQLSAEMARLHVTQRLTIPVGTDKFD